ncbi:pro-adrenomedullin [Pseudophryne corroboree]|uniref:pro-adrenomedullin n=1 Tax=Pseudophryne corroboree TaxID=495146 RepID=UPI0030821137
MELSYMILLHFSYLTFLGSVMGKTDVTSGDRKKLWNFIGMNRVRRDLQANLPLPIPNNDATSQVSFIKPEDTKDSLMPEISNGAHIRVKRYRHSFSNYPQISSRGCKFGTCIVHNLANQIYQYTDKDKDSTAPARKISSQGYGRRRRSVPDRKLLLPVVDGRIKPWWVSTGNSGSSPGAHQQLLDSSRADTLLQSRLSKTRDKLWQTLLRT